MTENEEIKVRESTESISVTTHLFTKDLTNSETKFMTRPLCLQFPVSERGVPVNVTRDQVHPVTHLSSTVLYSINSFL